MLTAILIILLLTGGGLAITYVITEDEPLLWRIAAGGVIGQCVFGTVLFVMASVGGLGIATVSGAIALSMSPLVLFASERYRKVFRHDRAKAKGTLESSGAGRTLGFFYFAFFFILFVLFFDRAIIINDQGIFTGGSNNLGDLPFHLGIIYSFTEGQNFPPQNPSFAGAKFAYPFVSDLITAAFLKLGSGIRESMLVQNVSWAFALLVVLARFTERLVNDRLTARIAPPLLFFSGGLGFLWFFSDYASQAKGFFQILGDIGKDYTIGDEFRWGNSMITLFLTQRSILIGMPVAIVILTGLWRIFATETQRRRENIAFVSYLNPAVLGVIAGLLPLIHLHSLFVLFVVTGFLFVMRPAKWHEWVAFGLGVCVVAVPELIWSITGSATRATEFFEFHFGWDSREHNFIWFWIKNTGLFIPLIAFGIYLVLSHGDHREIEPKKGSKKKPKYKELPSSAQDLVLFYIPFAFLFVLANVAKLAPWEWDNIKVMIYWFVGSLPFVGLAIARLWRRETALKVVAGVIYISLIAAGGLDVWRTVSGQHQYQVFDADAVTVANRVRAVTKPEALFLNAPTYNSAVVLSGRRSLMRYPGHLASHGIDFAARETDLRTMYRGGQYGLEIMKSYGIEYVLISPEERKSVSPDETFFATFPVVAESGQYKVYDIRQKHER